MAIALAFVAVLVILRYGSRPRCELCRRRHLRRIVQVIPVVAAAAGSPTHATGNGHGHVDVEQDPEIDLTSSCQPNDRDQESVRLELVAISWRADQHAAVPPPGDVETRA
jgi:hypothetical protein